MLKPEPLAILVVEDEILIRMALVEDLIRAGYSVIEAANVEEALAVLDGGLSVDLVFSDINLPGALDGTDLLKIVRQRFPSIPVILTSGQAAPDLGELEFRVPFVPKPYASRTVLDLVGQQVGRRDERDGAEPATAQRAYRTAD